MITYLRMSSAWHRGNGPVPRSLAGDGEVAAGGHDLLDVPGHAFGPDLATVAGEHSRLAEEKGSGFRAGIRWRVAGQGVDVWEQHPPRRPAAGSSGFGTAAARTRRARRAG